jgi:2,3,4,5-tetrahydropyridine-2-carboxylate N-succinyltransferase
MSHADLASTIDAAWETRDGIGVGTSGAIREAVEGALAMLDDGSARVAEKRDGGWHVHQWLKKAVLLSFRLNDMRVIPGGPDGAGWWDKVPSKFEGWGDNRFRAAGFRAVPGSFVRRGAYIAPGVVLMPSFVNLGAHVGENTMVDTWATIGSCAQVGRNCHISGGAGIAGVLEPLQANPVIIEDNCFVGARAEVAEGVVIGEGSVLSMGVYIGASTRIVDRATGEVFQGRVPPFSVVVPVRCPENRCPTARRAPRSIAASSSNVSTRRPAPRRASTSCCGIDGTDTSCTVSGAAFRSEIA